MLPSPLASLSCFHYFADKQSKNARSTTEKPVRHGRTAGVCLTKRERPESRNAGPRESSLKTLHDENGQGMRQPVRSSGRQAKTRKRTDTSFRPERELQRLRAVRRGYSGSLAVQVVVADDDYERARRPVGRRNGLGATDSLSRMRVAGRAFGSGRNPSETFRRLSARRPRRIGGTARQATSAGISGATGAERRSISSLCSSDGKRFQLHARNARQSAEGLLGFFSRSDVPVRGCVSDAWPEAPGRCEKPGRDHGPSIVLSGIPIILHLRPSVAGPATGESPTRFRTAPRRIPVSELPFRRERASNVIVSGAEVRSQSGERPLPAKAPGKRNTERNAREIRHPVRRPSHHTTGSGGGPTHAATRCYRKISSANGPRGRAESRAASDEASCGDDGSLCEHGTPV